MSMTQKDFEIIATTINRERVELQDLGHDEQVKYLHSYARLLSDSIEREYPRYSRKRFMAVCGFPLTPEQASEST